MHPAQARDIASSFDKGCLESVLIGTAYFCIGTLGSSELVKQLVIFSLRERGYSDLFQVTETSKELYPYGSVLLCHETGLRLWKTKYPVRSDISSSGILRTLSDGHIHHQGQFIYFFTLFFLEQRGLYIFETSVRKYMYQRMKLYCFLSLIRLS